MRLRYDPFQPRDPRTDTLGVLVPALVLAGLGLICVYSFGGAHVVRQAVWAAVGVAACLGVSRVPMETMRRAAGPLLGGAVLLLLVAHSRPWCIGSRPLRSAWRLSDQRVHRTVRDRG